MESGPKSSQTDGHWSQKRGGVGGVNPGCVWRGRGPRGTGSKKTIAFKAVAI